MARTGTEPAPSTPAKNPLAGTPGGGLLGVPSPSAIPPMSKPNTTPTQAPVVNDQPVGGYRRPDPTPAAVPGRTPTDTSASVAEITSYGGSAPVVNPFQAASNAGNVWMGKNYAGQDVRLPQGAVDPQSGINPGIVYDGRAQSIWTVDSAINYWYQMDDGGRKILDNATEAMGGYVNGYNSRALWSDAVQSAAYVTQTTGKLTSPWEQLRAMVDNYGKIHGASKGGGGGGGGGGTSVVVNLTNPSDAQAVLTDAYTAILGRAPSNEEKATFLKTLNNAERANPIVATPTSRSGGLNPQQAAKEVAMGDKSASEFTAASTFTDWLMAKISEDPTKGISSGV